MPSLAWHLLESGSLETFLAQGVLEETPLLRVRPKSRPRIARMTQRKVSRTAVKKLRKMRAETIAKIAAENEDLANSGRTSEKKRTNARSVENSRNKKVDENLLG